MAIGQVFKNGDKVMAKAVQVTSFDESTRCFRRQNKIKTFNLKVLSAFTKKRETSYNSRYIHGQFDLGGGVLEVADTNVRSIKLVEVELLNHQRNQFRLVRMKRYHQILLSRQK